MNSFHQMDYVRKLRDGCICSFCHYTQSVSLSFLFIVNVLFTVFVLMSWKPIQLGICICAFREQSCCRNKEDRSHWRWSESPEPPARNVNGDSKQNREKSSAHRNCEKIKSQKRRKMKDKETRRSRSCRTSNSHRKERRRKSSHSHSISK
jgi:hypothetical protein